MAGGEAVGGPHGGGGGGGGGGGRVGYSHEVNDQVGSAELCLLPVWQRLIETQTGKRFPRT